MSVLRRCCLLQNEKCVKNILLEYNEKLNFSKLEYDIYRKFCGFTEFENKVFELRQQGYSNIKIEIMLNVSSSTVDRTIKEIKRKIKKVILQYDDILKFYR